MTPPIWSDVSADLATATAQLRRAEEKAGTLAGLPPDLREDREVAIGKHLHDAYSAGEAALQRVILIVDGSLPQGGRYHGDLLDRAARPFEDLRGPAIRGETRDLLRRLVGFRHAYRHAYGAFEWDLAAPNLVLAARAIPMLVEDLTAFARPRG